MNKQYTARPKVTFKFLLELHLERKKTIQKEQRENKTKIIFVLMPLLSSSLQRGQMPTKNYLVTQICMKAWTTHLGAYHDLRKFDGWILDETAGEQTFNQNNRTFCKSGGLFNCEEKGKTLLSVVFSNLGDRENVWQNWHQTWAITSKAKISPWKGRCCSESP